jgi:hypothetical protein
LKLAQSSVAAKLVEMASIKNNADFARYIALRETMQGDPEMISAAIKEEFAALHLSQSMHLKTIERLLKGLQRARAEVADTSAQREQALSKLEDVVQRHFCAIGTVAGETRVYTLGIMLQLPIYAEKTSKDVIQWLASKDVVAHSAVLFQGQIGSVNWRLPLD